MSNPDFTLSPIEGPASIKYGAYVNYGEPGFKKYREIHYVGQPNSGKTFAMVDALIITVLSYPGCNVALVRDTYTNLQASALKTLKERAGPLFASGVFEHRVNDRIILVHQKGFPDSEIRLFGLDATDAEEKLLGYEPFRAFVDQAEGIKEELLNSLLTRLGRKKYYHRVTNHLGYGYVKLTSNWHTGMNWIYHRTQPGSKEIQPGFFERTITGAGLDGKEVEVKILLIKVRTEENESKPAEYNDFYVLAGGSRNKFFSEDWAANAGIVFPEFRAEKHETGEIEDLDGTTGICGLDHGISHPTVCIFGSLDNVGQLTIVDEYDQANRSATQNAQAIAQRMAVLNKRGVSEFIVYYDSSMDRRESDLSTVSEKYRTVFDQLPFRVIMEPSTRSLQGGGFLIEAGIGTMKDRLVAKTPSGNPAFQISRTTCRNTTIMLSSITYADIEADAVGTVDYFDALRYLVINIPEGFRGGVSKTAPVKSHAPRYRRIGAA